MSDLRRSIETWRNCVPSMMAMQSGAAIANAFQDMRHDILLLHAENEQLRRACGLSPKPSAFKDHSK